MRYRFLAFLYVALLYPAYVSAYTTLTLDTDTDFRAGYPENHDQTQVRGTGADANLELNFSYSQSQDLYEYERDYFSMSYDNITGKVVMFGGTKAAGEYKDETWTFDNTSGWVMVNPSTKPYARHGHASVSLGDGKILMFGGKNADDWFNETWIYTVQSNEWQAVATSTAPSGRAYFSMASDTTTKKVILFGGRDENWNVLSDTWEFDFNNSSWSQRTPVGPPAGRINGAMAFNPADGKYYMFGGEDGSENEKGDFWRYDIAESSWAYIGASGAPTARTDAAMYYDSTYSKLVLIGGYDVSDDYDNRVWCYSDAQGWYDAVPVSTPVARKAFGACYMTNIKKGFIFGGNSTIGRTDDYCYLTYRSTGCFTSAGIDSQVQSGFSWLKLYFVPSSQTSPITTSNAKVKVAHSTDGNSWTEEATTPDYPTSGSPLNFPPSFNNKRWIRYRTILDSGYMPLSPKIQKVVITYNYAPPVVSLSSPLNCGTTSYKEPLFLWSNIIDQDSYSAIFNDTITYHVQIDTWVGFTTPPVSIVNISSQAGTYSMYRTTIALDHGAWYWRVRAYDRTDYGSWQSTPFTLYIDTKPPNSITSISAQTGTGNGEIRLTWTNPPDVTPSFNQNYFYQVRFATYGPIDAAIYNAVSATEKEGTISATPGIQIPANVTGLENGTTYYFAVKILDQARNESGMTSTAYGAYTNAVPSVTLHVPLGGQGWTQDNTVGWSAFDPNPGDVLNFGIYVSSDSGSNYTMLVASGLPNGTTSYLWDTRGVGNATTYRLKITATDTRWLSASANSTSDFTVTNVNEAPAVTIISPNGVTPSSGTLTIKWQISDPNGGDTHVSDVYISSDSGVHFSWHYTTGANQYAINTRDFPNSPNYVLKIIATDSGSPALTGQATRDFTISNQNLAPRAFRLLSPINGSSRSPLSLEFSWENNGDPNPEDVIEYTLVLSPGSDFSSSLVFSGIKTNYYRISPGAAELERMYFWKVIARDPFGLETQSSDIGWTVFLSRFKAESLDGNFYAEVTSGLPADGFIKVEKINRNSYSRSIIQNADTDTLADRHLKTLFGDCYRVSICDASEAELDVGGDVALTARMYYPDSDGDGYYDGSRVSAENLRGALLNETAQKWELLPEYPALYKSQKRLSMSLNSLGVVTLAAALAPSSKVSSLVNFPNPFSPDKDGFTKIRYVLTENNDVTVSIYTLMGDLVWKQEYGAGSQGAVGQATGYTNEITWDGKNNIGKTAANGMYILEIRSGSEKQHRKIGIVK
ncbi:MAG: hypothetical protein JW803_05190 [Endomicrobiales bacterium]|nr:hypothetical protein [Endomicrobiales bacterium]